MTKHRLYTCCTPLKYSRVPGVSCILASEFICKKKEFFFFFFEILPFHYNDKYRITFARYFDLTTNIQIRYMYFSCWRGTFNSKIRLCLFTIPNESFFFSFFFNHSIYFQYAIAIQWNIHEYLVKLEYLFEK